MSARVLIVDDDAAVRFALGRVLRDADYEVVEAEHGVAALELLSRSAPVDLVISDLRMPVMDGEALLAELAVGPDAVPVIVITAHGSERDAVHAMKAGAIDYFAKPFDAGELLEVVRRNLPAGRSRRRARVLAAGHKVRRWMVFESEAMMRVAARIERVAPTDLPVLVTGETGTGKELVAEAVVGLSRRAEAPFIRANVSAIPRDMAAAELFGHTAGAFTGATRATEGLWGAAHTGTLFLDEVGDLGAAAQPMLLRALEQGEVRRVGEAQSRTLDVRVIAATNRRLDPPLFRADLRHRLEVARIELPPLRERPEDIVPLARHLARVGCARLLRDPVGFEPGLLDALSARLWPGNVRELGHAIEMLLVFSDGDTLQASALDTPGSVATSDLRTRVDRYERGLVVAALQRHSGNQTATAKALGIGRSTLRDKLRRYDLE